MQPLWRWTCSTALMRSHAWVEKDDSQSHANHVRRCGLDPQSHNHKEDTQLQQVNAGPKSVIIANK